MITGLPSEAESLSPRMRATRSLGPPVVTGTTILIGLAGQPPCAQAPAETHSATNNAENLIYVSPSVDRRTGSANHLAPLLVLVAHEAGELLRAHRGRLHARCAKVLLQFRILQCLRRFRVKA